MRYKEGRGTAAFTPREGIFWQGGQIGASKAEKGITVQAEKALQAGRGVTGREGNYRQRGYRRKRWAL